MQSGNCVYFICFISLFEHGLGFQSFLEMGIVDYTLVVVHVVELSKVGVRIPSRT